MYILTKTDPPSYLFWGYITINLMAFRRPILVVVPTYTQYRQTGKSDLWESGRRQGAAISPVLADGGHTAAARGEIGEALKLSVDTRF